MHLRTCLFGCSLAISPVIACNNILGLERAELAATAAQGGNGPDQGGQSGSAGSSPATSFDAGGSGVGGTTLDGSGGSIAEALGGTSGATTDPSVGDQGGTGGVDSNSGGADAGGTKTSGPGGADFGGTNTLGPGGATSVLAGQAGCAAGEGSTARSCSTQPNPKFACIDGWLTSCAPDGTPTTKQCRSQELCDAANGQCDVCAADTTRCVDDRQLAQCSSDGQNETVSACSGALPYCSGGACVACLTGPHCEDPGECLDPVCTAEHACAQSPSAAGTTCVSNASSGVCDGQGHCGACKPDDVRCSAEGLPELCVAQGAEGGHWITQAACSTSASAVPLTCISGRCEPPPSCRAMAAGTVQQCGVGQNRHCCESPGVPGMDFTMGTNSGSTDGDVNPRETPAIQASVGAFRLDAFEVTVGRFRRFVADYQGPPAVGAGFNPYQPSATGWKAEWNDQLPAAGPDARAAILAKIGASSPYSTWTNEPSTREAYPINQLTWYLAFAFCAYDGGWLPSEAEWEAVASGTDSSNKNYYPWGAKSDGPSTDRATYGFVCLNDPCPIEGIIRRVGSAAAGVSAFGQYDVAGNVAEWMMDYYDASYYSTYIDSRCYDCVNIITPPGGERTVRGGGAWSSAAYLRVTARNYASAGGVNKAVGLRCARPR